MPSQPRGRLRRACPAHGAGSRTAQRVERSGRAHADRHGDQCHRRQGTSCLRPYWKPAVRALAVLMVLVLSTAGAEAALSRAELSAAAVTLPVNAHLDLSLAATDT